MKKKLPLLFLASALLFSACTAPAATPSGEGQQEGGEGQGGGSQSETVSLTDIRLNKHVLTLKAGESQLLVPAFTPVNATNKNVTWTIEDTSVATVSKTGVVRGIAAGQTVVTVKSEDGNLTDDCLISVTDSSSGGGSQGGGSEGGESGGGSEQGGGSEGGESGEDIDLDGYVAIAKAPEGVVLTDWTDEMKAIFNTYLDGNIPPFFWMTNLQVTYDNLDILQVRGDATADCLTRYEALLDADGRFACYIGQDNAGRDHIYGRLLGDLTLVELDGLSANGLFSINFDLTVATYTWPAEGIADLIKEEYESRQTVLPQYEYENARYIIESDVMSNLLIYCMGAPRTAPAEYKALLEEYRWSVVENTEGEYAGHYFAASRDRRVIADFYHDGTGLMIQLTHGEGESYTTWDSCLDAIDDFGEVELRMTSKLSALIPEVPTAELYEISRDVRGGLTITTYKHTDFTQADIFNYGMTAQTNSNGGLQFTMKGNSYWLVDSLNHVFAIELTLGEYVSDTLAVNTIQFTIFDYKVFEGAVVYYGAWPTSQVATIVRNINSKLFVPAYNDEDATYYVFSSYGTTITIELRYQKANALETYKALLEDNGYTVTDIANGYTAIDRNEYAQITVTLVDEEMTIKLEKYTKSDATATKAAFNFETMNQLVDVGNWSEVTWKNGQVTFVAKKGTSSRDIAGGYRDQGQLYNPLRLYKGQQIEITTTSGTLSKLEFYVTDNTDGTHTLAKFALNNLDGATVVGGAFATHNTNINMVRFTANENVTTITITIDGANMKSDEGVLITSLDVLMNA